MRQKSTSVTIRKLDGAPGYLIPTKHLAEISFHQAGARTETTTVPRGEIMDWIRRWLADEA